MARFCFYCGEELKEGESCTCRFKSQAHTSTSKPDNQPFQSSHQGSSASPKSHHSNYTRAKAKPHRYKYAQYHNKKPMFKALFGSWLLKLASLVQKITHPVDVLIASGSYLKRQNAAVFALIKSITVGLILTISIGISARLALGAIFGTALAQTSLTWKGFFALWGFFSCFSLLLTAALITVCCLIAYLTVGKHRLQWTECLALCRPAYLYALIPLIFGGSSSVVYSFVFLILSLALEVFLSLLAVKMRLRLDSNGAVYFGLSASFIYCGIVAVFIHLGIRILPLLLMI